MFLPHRRSQAGVNEFEPGCADMEGTVEADAASPGSSDVRGKQALAAPSLEGAGVKGSAGCRGSEQNKMFPCFLPYISMSYISMYGSVMYNKMLENDHL